jgi:hypothetical protein
MGRIQVLAWLAKNLLAAAGRKRGGPRKCPALETAVRARQQQEQQRQYTAATRAEPRTGVITSVTV